MVAGLGATETDEETDATGAEMGAAAPHALRVSEAARASVTKPVFEVGMGRSSQKGMTSAR